MQDVIDRTNRFYLEMSRKLLSEQQYELLERLLIEKMPLEQAAVQYGYAPKEVEELFQKTCSMAQEAAELFSKTSHYHENLHELKQQSNPNPSPAAARKQKAQQDRRRMLLGSDFVFSQRMRGVLEALEIKTIGELADIPLQDFLHFRGFKAKCKEELAAFIESENIGYLFKGFKAWKKQPIEQLK